MKVCVYGSGGVGAYFGARLVESGADVTFIARGENLGVMQNAGLKVSGVSGPLHLQNVQVDNNPSRNAPYNLVIVAVKAWQVKEAGAALKGLLAENATVVPLQNGVEASDELAGILGEPAVVTGICGIVSFLKAPGHVYHAGVDPFIKIGERDGSASTRVSEVVEFLNHANGVTASVPDDIRVAYWLKFMFIVTMSGIGSVTRAPIGICRQNPEIRSIMRECATEVLMVARACGIPLQSDSVGNTMKMLDDAPAEATASMQRDIVAGKPSELHYQNSAVSRLGKRFGVATPVNDFISAVLKPQEDRARSETEF